MGKSELVALLRLSSHRLVIVVWLFFAVPWVCLQFVVVVFPDHTHLLFFIILPIWQASQMCCGCFLDETLNAHHKIYIVIQHRGGFLVT